VANHIQTLQRTVAEQATVIEQLADWRTACRILLDLDKFKGVDSEGERKDWIATTDVLRMLDSAPFYFNEEG
jgi:hypothetical protein